MLAQLHLQSLEDKTSPKAVIRALEDLPRGKQALNGAFSDAIQRIERQPEGFAALAKKVLGWLTYGKELMTLQVLQHAIATEPGEEEFDQENLSDTDQLISVCAGLVLVDQSDKVKLVHYTAQEYLQQNSEDLLPEFPLIIAMSCLTCLQYNTFKQWSKEKHDTAYDLFKRKEPLIKDYPYYPYAVRFWASHVEACEFYAVEDLFMNFVNHDLLVSQTAQNLCFLGENGMKDIVLQTTDISIMHLLAYLGASDLMLLLIRRGFDPHIKDSASSTPLWWAAYQGNEKAMEVLLSQDGVDINNRSTEYNGTLLGAAAINGYLGIVKRLLDCRGIEINSMQTDDEWTPLFGAVCGGYDEIVEAFLARNDIQVDTKDNIGQTPLACAVSQQYPDIVQRLLQRVDVNPNSAGISGDSPLSWAVEYNNFQITWLLLNDSRIDVNWKNNSGMTPLMLAVARKRLEMTQLLLADDRVDVNAEENNGYTALIIAVAKGYEGIVRDLLLLRKDHILFDNQHPEQSGHIQFIEAKVRNCDENRKSWKTSYTWSRPIDETRDLQRQQSVCLELCRTALKGRGGHNKYFS